VTISGRSRNDAAFTRGWGRGVKAIMRTCSEVWGEKNVDDG
jgi:hypothetical protein